MRRYGSLKYGSTQYGLGTVETYAAVTVTFSDDIRQFTLVPVHHPYMEDAATFSEDLRYTSTAQIQLVDNVTFSNKFDADLLKDVRVADNIVFDLDIRLKYVVTRMSNTIQFNLDTNTSIFEEQFAFDALISYPIVVKSVYMADLLAFDNAIHVRRDWEQLPNPLDEIWTPRPHDGDTWTPRVNPLDEIWTKRNSVGEYWVERTSPDDVWVTYGNRSAIVNIKTPVPVASVAVSVGVAAAVDAVAPAATAAADVIGFLALVVVAADAPKPAVEATASVGVAATVSAIAPKPVTAASVSVVAATASAAVAGITPKPVAAANAIVVASAAVAASTPKPTAAAGTSVGVLAAVAAIAPKPTAAVGTSVGVSAAIAALAPKPTAASSVTVSEGGGLWTPDQITSGMYGWWDASDAASLTFSGINLLEIADQGPNNIHMGRAASSGPTVSSINGLGALAFTYDQGLMTANPTTFGDFTIFAVFNPGFSDGSTYERIVDHSYGEGWWFGRTGSTQTFGGGIQDGPPNYGIFVPLANNEAHLISMDRTGGTHTVKGNGGAVSNSRAIHTNITASNRVYMGQDNLGTSDVTDGEHGEVIIWSRSLSADEMAKTEGYLAWKWHTEAKLPVGHPYKSAPPTTGVAPIAVSVAAIAPKPTAAAFPTVGITASVAASAVAATAAAAVDVEEEGAGTGPASVLVTAFTPGTDRNDFTGQVGVRLGIGASNIPFKWMGMRKHHASQIGNHTVKLYEWFGDTLERSAVIDMTSVAVGDWGWTEVAPYNLLASGYYALLMDVTASDGKIWCNPGPVTMVAGFSNIYDSYRVPGSGLSTGLVNSMFNGLDLGDGDAGAGAAVSVAVAATAAPATAASVVSVYHPSQLYVSGELGGVWDYTNQNTLYSTAGTSAPSAVNDPIYHLLDISGTGLTMTRVGADTARPTHTLSAGGVHYALFDGASDRMATPLSLPLKPGVMMFFAMRPVINPAGGRSHGGLGTTTATNRMVINRSVSRSEIGIRVDTLSVAQAAIQGASGDFALNTNCVIRITVNSGNITYHRNGTLLCTLVNTLDGADVLNNSRFMVGDSEAAAPANVAIFAVSYINRILTGTEITNYEAWLAARYAGF